MLRAEIYKTVVTDTKLFNRTGDVGRWAERVKVAFVAHAIEQAPTGASTGRVNKSRANAAFPVGSLKASIRGDVERIGPRHLQTTVSANTPYAIHVIKGTGPIFSRSARIPAGQAGAGQFAPIGFGFGGMYIPANPGWGKAKIRQHVSGQRANNFLGRAFDATARTHSSLRGFSMGG